MSYISNIMFVLFDSEILFQIKGCVFFNRFNSCIN